MAVGVAEDSDVDQEHENDFENELHDFDNYCRNYRINGDNTPQSMNITYSNNSNLGFNGINNITNNRNRCITSKNTSKTSICSAHRYAPKHKDTEEHNIIESKTLGGCGKMLHLLPQQADKMYCGSYNIAQSLAEDHRSDWDIYRNLKNVDVLLNEESVRASEGGPCVSTNITSGGRSDGRGPEQEEDRNFYYNINKISDGFGRGRAQEADGRIINDGLGRDRAPEVDGRIIKMGCCEKSGNLDSSNVLSRVNFIGDNGLNQLSTPKAKKRKFHEISGRGVEPSGDNGCRRLYNMEPEYGAYPYYKGDFDTFWDKYYNYKMSVTWFCQFLMKV